MKGVRHFSEYCCVSKYSHHPKDNPVAVQVGTLHGYTSLAESAEIYGASGASGGTVSTLGLGAQGSN